MPTIVFKPKRSGVASAVPTTANLADGEVAINYTDGKIYQRVGGTVYEVANADVASTIAWGNITGKPTTLSGYGITDAVTTNTAQTVTGAKTFSGEVIFSKYGNTHFGFGANNDVILTYGSAGRLTARTWDGSVYSAQFDIWHEGNFDPTTKANVATTLAGYGIADALSVNGNQTVPGIKTFEVRVNVQATSGNAHYYLQDNTGAVKGLLFWNVASDALHLRHYVGGAVMGELKIDETIFAFNDEIIWHEGNFDPANHSQPFSTITGTISDAQLPERLGPYAETVTDWNNVTKSGWYMGNSATNTPAAGWVLGYCEVHNPLWVTQTVHRFTADTSSSDTMTYRRSSNNGVWGAWYRLRLSEDEQATLWAAKVSDGRTSVKNANSATMTTQPRVFVQSGDPGAAAADGDLWFW